MRKKPKKIEWTIDVDESINDYCLPDCINTECGIEERELKHKFIFPPIPNSEILAEDTSIHPIFGTQIKTRYSRSDMDTDDPKIHFQTSFGFEFYAIPLEFKDDPSSKK